MFDPETTEEEIYRRTWVVIQEYGVTTSSKDIQVAVPEEGRFFSGEGKGKRKGAGPKKKKKNECGRGLKSEYSKEKPGRKSKGGG